MALGASERPPLDSSKFSQYYPLTDRQRLICRLLSHWQNTQVVVIVIASLLSILALVRVPAPTLRIAQAVLCFILAASTGLALAYGIAQLTNQSYFRRAWGRTPPKTRATPLLLKEIRYFARTLDPYVGLAVSAVFAYSEYLASWLTPAKAALPLLMVAMVQLSAIVNPFALDSAREVDRYRLMPLPPWRISAHKHLSLLTILLLTMSPLMAAAFLRMSLQDDLATLVELCIILASWLCSGVILMRLEESRKVQMSFGSLSGTGFSLGLFGLAALISGSAPLANAFVLRSESSPFGVLLSVVLLCALCAAYAIGLRSSSRTRLYSS